MVPPKYDQLRLDRYTTLSHKLIFLRAFRHTVLQEHRFLIEAYIAKGKF
jgi:hypothetical protein